MNLKPKEIAIVFVLTIVFSIAYLYVLGFAGALATQLMGGNLWGMLVGPVIVVVASLIGLFVYKQNRKSK